MTSIEFQYEPGEYARAVRRFRIRHFGIVRDATLFSVVLVGAIASHSEHWINRVIYAFVGLYVLMVGLSVGLYPILVPRFRTHLIEPYRLKFSDAEIDFSTPTVASRLPWTVYRSWTRDEEFFYLSIGHGHVTIIPRRAFHRVEDESEFAALLDRKLNSKRAAA